MPDFEIKMTFKGCPSMARPCIEAWLLTLKDDYGGWITKSDMKWAEDHAAFVLGIAALGGVELKGEVGLAEGSVRLNGRIPLRAVLLRSKLEQTMKDAFTKVCAKCAEAKTAH
jgi:hypothetical protein